MLLANEAPLGEKSKLLEKVVWTSHIVSNWMNFPILPLLVMHLDIMSPATPMPTWSDRRNASLGWNGGHLLTLLQFGTMVFVPPKWANIINHTFPTNASKFASLFDMTYEVSLSQGSIPSKFCIQHTLHWKGMHIWTPFTPALSLHSWSSWQCHTFSLSTLISIMGKIVLSRQVLHCFCQGRWGSWLRRCPSSFSLSPSRQRRFLYNSTSNCIHLRHQCMVNGSTLPHHKGSWPEGNIRWDGTWEIAHFVEQLSPVWSKQMRNHNDMKGICPFMSSA